MSTTQAFAITDSILCQKHGDNQISFSNSVQPRLPSDEITIVTWNGEKFGNPKYFYDVKDLSLTSDLILIQEALHSSGWQAAFASHMSMDFSFYKSFCESDDQATGVMTASRFPILSPVTLVSPGTEPGLFTHKVSGYSAVQINGTRVHVINTHALNFNTGRGFEDQIQQLSNFISQLEGPVIWAGDFNTWSPARKKFLSTQATRLGLNHILPSNDRRKLRLDHIYVRGFTPLKAEVLKLNTSDHEPIRAVLKINR